MKKSGATDIDEELPPIDVAELILEQGIAALDASAAMLFTLDEASETLSLLASKNYPGETAAAFSEIPVDGRLPASDAVREARPIYIESPQEFPRRYPELASRVEVTTSAAFACLPLIDRTRVIGVAVLSFREPRVFGPTDRAFMNAAANLGALALERARQNEARRLEEQRARLLATIGTVLAGALDPQRMIEEVAQATVPGLADWCIIELARFGKPGRRLAVAHVDSATADLAMQPRKRILPDPARGRGKVLRTGESELYTTIGADHLAAVAADAEDLESLRSLGMTSAMIVPIPARSHNVGTLTFVSMSDERRFDRDDVEFGEELGRRLGVALESLRMYLAATTLAKLGREGITETAEGVLELAVEVLADHLDVEFATFVEQSPIDGSLVVRAGVGWPDAAVGSGRIPPRVRAHADHTLQVKRPVIVDDFASETRFSGPFCDEEHRVVSGLSKYVPGPDAPYGVLMVHSRARRVFTAEEIQFARSVANIIAASVARERSHAVIEGERLRMAAFVESAMDAIISVGADQRIKEFNRAAELMFGYALDEVRGRPLTMLMPDRFRGRHEAHVRTFGETGVTTRAMGALGTLRALRSNGDEFPIEATISQVSTADREKLYTVIVRDVTERVRAEQELREAARQKDHFLAMLGHELRNPLGAIQSAAQLQGIASEEPEVVEKARSVIERQVSQMVRLVDDLLDVSRIVRGKIQLELEPLDLRDVVRLVVEDYGPIADDAGLEMSLVDRESDGLWITADRARIVQVLGNLVANAVKFTAPGGEIRVVVSREEDEAVIVVEDTGVGIESRHLDQIFEPFQQVEGRQSNSTSGLGLGLALVKGLVGLHDGDVAVRSGGLGHGAAFEVRFSLSGVDGVAEPVARENEETLNRKRVLIVEDDESGAEMLRELLEHLGCKVRVAGDGTEALDVAPEFDAEIVLCDIGLPGELSGYDVARRLVGSGVRPDLLVALTGYGRAEDRDRAIESGFDQHLTKPIDLDRLRQLIEAYSESGSG